MSVHEDVENFKFGVICERILCMFKHQDNIETSLIDVIEEEVVTHNETFETVIIDEQEEFMKKEKMFKNPSKQVSNDEMFKCKMRDFAVALVL